MGQIVQFFAGDAVAIGADFTAGTARVTDGGPARACADFSLHLSPGDLDVLSEVIAGRVGVPPLLLNDQLGRSVGGNAGECGVEIVSSNWARMVASAEADAAGELAADWAQRLSEEYGEEFPVTTEAVEAIGNLIRLCRFALREGVAVVHTWRL